MPIPAEDRGEAKALGGTVAMRSKRYEGFKQ